LATARWVLEGHSGRVPRDPRAALLVAQDRRRARRLAEVRAPGGEDGARGDLQAGNRDRAAEAAEAAWASAADYGTKWPKAAAKITDDLDVLLAFDDFPAEHRVHLRTTTRSSPPSPP
jgi:hypothetical protein